MDDKKRLPSSNLIFTMCEFGWHDRQSSPSCNIKLHYEQFVSNSYLKSFDYGPWTQTVDYINGASKL